jgi:hypothetical protein
MLTETNPFAKQILRLDQAKSGQECPRSVRAQPDARARVEVKN